MEDKQIKELNQRYQRILKEKMSIRKQLEDLKIEKEKNEDELEEKQKIMQLLEEKKRPSFEQAVQQVDILKNEITDLEFKIHLLKYGHFNNLKHDPQFIEYMENVKRIYDLGNEDKDNINDNNKNLDYEEEVIPEEPKARLGYLLRAIKDIESENEDLKKIISSNEK